MYVTLVQKVLGDKIVSDIKIVEEDVKGEQYICVYCGAIAIVPNKIHGDHFWCQECIRPWLMKSRRKEFTAKEISKAMRTYEIKEWEEKFDHVKKVVAR